MRERIFAGLVRNISAGTRLALFLPVRWLQFRASPGQFALLAGFNFLVWGLSSTLQAGGGVFNPTAIAVYLAQIPLLLLASLLIASVPLVVGVEPADAFERWLLERIAASRAVPRTPHSAPRTRLA